MKILLETKSVYRELADLGIMKILLETKPQRSDLWSDPLSDLDEDCLSFHSSSSPINTICLCEVASMASLLLFLCKKILQSMYVLWNPNETMKLYEFVIIFGVLMLILAQIPSFHLLRHINLISLVICLLYSACATTASIYIGNSSKGPHKDYSLSSSDETRIFEIFNAMAITI
nr:GABA transporter 1 [Tanacetum cinerariifolium]